MKNEPVLEYLKGSKEQKELCAALEDTACTTEEVPIIIGDKEYRTKDVRYQVAKAKRFFLRIEYNRFVLQVMPHDHQKKIAKFYYADANLLKKAIETASEAQKEWDQVPISERWGVRCKY